MDAENGPRLGLLLQQLIKAEILIKEGKNQKDEGDNKIFVRFLGVKTRMNMFIEVHSY